ncbi:kelch domain-containing protein 10 homolog isoform X2 [Microplitis mediator]|uniref:kelch domain-containing protein 10 homolog isoform X2 n=1 Tax=Microplitis mediator TaxID=375433 RepID=UPI00255779F7|nr:kelch domain-containing protein 10 homolog isoform X2 [Microplitis mediator]XP_057321780.1 kelch domain-containing protein 10 homolog isoform X2 [Microplitis mediator]
MYAFKPHVFTEHSPISIAKPEGRLISSIRCDDKNLYTYNGIILTSSGRINSRDLWVYNLAGQQWRSMRNEHFLPCTHELIIGTIYESNYLVICTIQVPFNDEQSSQKCLLHICDLNTESVVVQETSGQIPDSLYPRNLIRHGKYYYTVGITRNNEGFSDVYKLNTENNVWEIVYICRGLDANEPYRRSGHTLVYSNNMIYIFGGGRDDDPVLDAYCLKEIWAFDLEKCCWKKKDTHGDENHTPQYPSNREGFGITSYTDPDSGEINVIISGGTGFDYEYCDEDGWQGYYLNNMVVFNDVWRLNLTSLKWTCLERFGTVLPSHVEDHSMTVSPAGKLFTFGGFIFGNDMRHGTCPSTLHSTWLRIPNLTDMCWEAVFHYYPDLKSMTDKEIISLGIPPKLLKSRIN